MARIKLTASRSELLDLYDTYTARDIAGLFDVKESTVRSRLRKERIRKPIFEDFTFDETEELLAIRRERVKEEIESAFNEWARSQDLKGYSRSKWQSVFNDIIGGTDFNPESDDETWQSLDYERYEGPKGDKHIVNVMKLRYNEKQKVLEITLRGKKYKS